MPCTRSKPEISNLQSILQSYLKSNLFIINRIDQPVSGICVFAKNKSAAAHLSQQWKNHKVKKSYLGVTRGDVSTCEGRHEVELMKLKRINKSVVVDEKSSSSKSATMEIKLIDQTDYLNLMSIKPLTGRHHQIRAQLGFLNCAIRGDVKYGDKRGNRDGSINLHAYEITFEHPGSHKNVSFTCPPPETPPWIHFKQYNHV